MRSDIFLQKSSNLFMENRLLKCVISVMALAVIVNSFMVYRAVKYQRVVLIPPQMTGTVEFVQGRPSDQYIRDMTRRILSLAVTYSPATARAQFDELLAYYAPEAYPEASASWYDLASRVEEALVSTVFYSTKIFVENERIEISGDYRQFAGNQLVASGPRAYTVRFQIQDGRFEILSFQERR